MKTIILPLLTLVALGCSPATENRSAPEITVQDIAKAMHLQKWTIKVPDTLQEDCKMVLKLTYGEKSRVFANISSTPGETATVMVWQNGDGTTFFRTDNRDSGEYGTLKADGFDPGSFSTGKNSDHICDAEETLMSGFFEGSDERYRLYASIENKEQ